MSHHDCSNGWNGRHESEGFTERAEEAECDCSCSDVRSMTAIMSRFSASGFLSQLSQSEFTVNIRMSVSNGPLEDRRRQRG